MARQKNRPAPLGEDEANAWAERMFKMYEVERPRRHQRPIDDLFYALDAGLMRLPVDLAIDILARGEDESWPAHARAELCSLIAEKVQKDQPDTPEIAVALFERAVELEPTPETIQLLQQQRQNYERRNAADPMARFRTSPAGYRRSAKLRASIRQTLDAFGVTDEELEEVKTKASRRHKARR